MNSRNKLSYLALVVPALVLAQCSSTPVTQTVLRFGASSALAVPAGAQLQLFFWPEGRRQHEEPQPLGPYPFVDDIKLTVDAVDNDGTRRFTVFAELLDGDRRLSWARVRTGFVQDELSEVRIEFGEGCLEPADRPITGFDSAATCGSHDSCGPRGECTPSCVTPVAFDSGASPSAPTGCPEEDCLAVDEIESGRDLVCVLSGGEAFCWGRAARSVSTWNAHHRRPSRVAGPDGVATFSDNITSISANALQVCLVDDGVPRCGGRSTDAEPFLGGPRPDVRPCCEVTLEPPSTTASEVRTTATASFVVDTSGVITQIGRRPGGVATDVTGVLEPLFDGRGGADRIVGQWDGLCAFRSGNVECINSTFAGDASDVAAADGAILTICLISSSGILSCYGRDLDQSPFAVEPHIVAGEWQSVTLARQFIGDDQAACGIRNDGALECWGDAAGGRTGTDEFRPDSDPMRIDVPFSWQDVALGTEHACGISNEGDVYCWGANTVGQLGREGPDATAPERVCVPGF